MKIKDLNFYSRLENILSRPYYNTLLEIFNNVETRNVSAMMNIYSCFIDVSVERSGLSYNALDIFNDKNYFNEHFQSLVGFIYTEFGYLLIRGQYDYINIFKIVFKQLATQHKIILLEMKISNRKLSDDALLCIERYKSMNKNKILLTYYKGWSCKSKEGKTQDLHLSNIYNYYGPSFTNDIYKALSFYAKTQKSTTFRVNIVLLINLLNEFTHHCRTLEELNNSLKSTNSTTFMLCVFNTLVAKKITNNNNVKNFFKSWKNTINIFMECFIGSGVFEFPSKPFIAPIYRKQITHQTSVSIGGTFPNKLDSYLFSNIPLEIRDDTVLKIIEERIEKNLKHILFVSNQWVDELNNRHQQNIKFREKGLIKPYPFKSQGNIPYPIGLDYIENTVATFYHYGHNYNGTKYITFLCCSGQKYELEKMLNLPTADTLMALLIQLVLEHPQITPAWLHEWELYSKNGDMIGLKQTSEQWVAVSFKHRRGTAQAQQEIILNAHSKNIVDLLIQHTEFARVSLKKKGNGDWRYMVLTSSLTRSHRFSDLNQSLLKTSRFESSLATDSYDDEGQLILDKDDAKELSSSVTLRSIRSAVGLKIYLETHSINAVAKALGHKKVNIKLLESYLPTPLMNYFNTRWVRIFQNAIIFEALKDSPLLVDALDFTEDKLEEFLENHRLQNLPDHLAKAEESAINEENQNDIAKLDQLSFIITTPLLQLLIAITSMVRNSTEHESFVPVIERWYESAVFILNHFTVTDDAVRQIVGLTSELKSLYDTAVDNPLDVDKLKANFLCI